MREDKGSREPLLLRVIFYKYKIYLCKSVEGEDVEDFRFYQPIPLYLFIERIQPETLSFVMSFMYGYFFKGQTELRE